jgi:uncharacterized membrane protein
MATVTKNRNFFKWPKLLYFMPECAQIKQQWTIKISSLLFSILSLAAILVGSRDHRTHFWKGAIQESFQQSLVEIGSVVSEELCPTAPPSIQDGCCY